MVREVFVASGFTPGDHVIQSRGAAKNPSAKPKPSPAQFLGPQVGPMPPLAVRSARGFLDKLGMTTDGLAFVMNNSITITMLYFAIFREHIGVQSEEITLPAGTTAGEIFDVVVANHPALEPMRASTLVMVNEAYADADQPLQDGDEIALIPPVSGGDHRFICTEDELDPRVIEALVASDDAGALVTFTGTVRNHARGRSVASLEYEAYPPAAAKMLAQVGAEVQEQWPGVRIAIAHRFGHLYPGEASVVIACSCAHRDEAYAASSWAISRIKEIVPIWKKEHYEDGSAWIGSEHAYQVETGRIPEE